MIIRAYVQEDVAEGAITSWPTRGVRSSTAATGNGTRQASNGGVRFTGTQNIQWAVDNDVLRIHRWGVAIAKGDVTASASGTVQPVMTIHTAQGGTGRGHPQINFIPSTDIFRVAMNDGSSKVLSAAAVAGWNVLVWYTRGWEFGGWINGTQISPLEFRSMSPNTENSPSWLGSGVTAPGSAALLFDIDVDCVIIGQGELTDTLIDKLVGWAHHRVARTDLLAGGHPYKTVAPTSGAHFPDFYVHDNDGWSDFDTSSVDRSNFGLPPPAADSDYVRVFFDDFLVDSVVDDVTGAPTDIWFCPTLGSETIAAAAIARRKSDLPSCYHHDATAPGFVSLVLQESSPGSGIAHSGLFSSVNKSAKGRCWSGECIFKTRHRLRNIPAMPASPGWPGLWPAWWFYGKESFFWRTRRRHEYDFFEGEGALVNDDRIADTFHAHDSTIDYPPGEAEPGYSNAGAFGTNHLNTNAVAEGGMPRGWPVDFHHYDGEWHICEWRVEEDVTIGILNETELGRKTHTIPNFMLHPKFMIFAFALRIASGAPIDNQGPFYFDIDTAEVWKKEADLAVVPSDGFSARPTIAGTRGVSNTITLTPNAVDAGDTLEIRWYYDGGKPIIGQVDTTFVETSATANTKLRAHVRNLSKRNQPEAWTAALPSFAEPWTGTNGDAWSATRWTVGTAGGTAVVDIQGDKGRMLPNATDTWTRALSTSPTYTSLDLTVQFTLTVSTNQFHWIHFRHTSGWNGSSPQRPQNGYSVAIWNDGANRFSLASVVAGASTVLASPDNKAWSTGQWNLRISADGTALKVKAWQGTQPNTWDMEVTNGDHASGVISIASVASAASQPVLWDNLNV